MSGTTPCTVPTCFPATRALPLALLSADYLDGRKLNVKYLPLQWYVTLLTLPRTGSSRIPLEEVYLFSFFFPPPFLCHSFLFCLPSLLRDRHLNLAINEDTSLNVFLSNRSQSEVLWLCAGLKEEQGVLSSLVWRFMWIVFQPAVLVLSCVNLPTPTPPSKDTLFVGLFILWRDSSLEGDSQMSEQWKKGENKGESGMHFRWDDLNFHWRMPRSGIPWHSSRSVTSTNSEWMLESSNCCHECGLNVWHYPAPPPHPPPTHHHHSTFQGFLLFQVKHYGFL